MKDLIFTGAKISLLILTFIIFSGCSHTSNTQVRVVKKSQTAAGFNVQLGLGYLEQGNMQRAKIKLLLAMKQAPDWPPVLNAMAYFLEKTGDVAEATKYYNRSLELSPHDGSVLNNYGTFLCRQKHYQEAEKYFLQAVDDPNYLTISEAYENAGLCALAIPDNKKAIQYFDKALLQDPSRPASLYELAALFYKQQQYAKAKQYIDRYLSLAQENPRVLLLANQVALKLNDKDAALRFANLLKAHFPTSQEYKQIK